MNDPVVQNTKEYHDKLAKYNRDFEEECEKVSQEMSTIDGFIQNLYENMPDLDMALLGLYLNRRDKDDIADMVLKYFDSYVIDEAKRNLE